MSRPFFLPPVPKFLIRLVAGEMSTLVFNSQNVSASKLTDKGYQFIYPDLLPAMKSFL
jgi:NAD dependent epimerase/dehydratase family enzyme